MLCVSLNPQPHHHLHHSNLPTTPMFNLLKNSIVCFLMIWSLIKVSGTSKRHVSTYHFVNTFTCYSSNNHLLTSFSLSLLKTTTTACRCTTKPESMNSSVTVTKSAYKWYYTINKFLLAKNIPTYVVLGSRFWVRLCIISLGLCGSSVYELFI